MSGKRIIFYILSSLIAGTLVLVYVEYNSTRHVNALIAANNKLVDEFQITTSLSDLNKSTVIVQLKLRGCIESGDTNYLEGLDDEIGKIQTSQAFLRTISDDSSTVALVAQLDRFIQMKVGLFYRVLDTYRRNGVKAAEDTINVNLPLWVSFEMENTIGQINRTRAHLFASITASIQSSGRGALQFSHILIALVVLAAVVVFWYIIYIIQKLIRSEKKIREAARIKENFLANMSHEIRTPMNAILGYTQLLAQKTLDIEAQHYVHSIESSGENLLAIVNDILDISKIEAGMMRIEKVAFSLRGLVNSVEMMGLPKANAKGIRLTVEVDNAIPDILDGDPVRLTQILTNLMSNGIKFTREGSVSLKVAIAERLDNVVKLRIEISDTGIGIDPQKLKHIFDRFEQADGTITREYGGTGLGLSIVKDLAELQNGTIQVESEPGRGTVFQVIIPYEISIRKIDDIFAEPELSVSNVTNSDVRILVTEDNEINQDLLTNILSKWKIEFNIASNGLEAIEKLKKNKYDLVLMDIQMPVMDGYTTARKIRNELQLNIPIIAMTAHAMPGEKEKCLNHGMNDYISKPLKQEQLSLLISRFTLFIRPALKEAMMAVRPNNFQYIHPEYIKDVSAGNTSYERRLMQKFLRALPMELQELENALKNENVEKLKKIAHNLKTTVSVMGLNELLNPLLDEIELVDAGWPRYREIIEKLIDYCNKAIAETKEFLITD